MRASPVASPSRLQRVPGVDGLRGRLLVLAVRPARRARRPRSGPGRSPCGGSAGSGGRRRWGWRCRAPGRAARRGGSPRRPGRTGPGRRRRRGNTRSGSGGRCSGRRRTRRPDWRAPPCRHHAAPGGVVDEGVRRWCRRARPRPAAQRRARSVAAVAVSPELVGDEGQARQLGQLLAAEVGIHVDRRSGRGRRSASAASAARTAAQVGRRRRAGGPRSRWSRGGGSSSRCCPSTPVSVPLSVE